jgi:uncharacterized membrane protein
VRVTEQFDVSAPVDVVWGVLADVERWPSWTASMSKVEVINGPADTGARVRIKQPKFPTFTWQVTEWEPGHAFTWASSSSGVYSVAKHRVEPAGDGTRVTLSIEQRGPLAWLVALLAGGVTRRYVAMEAAGLKARAEAIAQQRQAEAAATTPGPPRA